MRSFSLIAVSLLIAGCASPTPPTPPLAITSHAVTAVDYPAESVRLREVGTAQVQYLVLTDGTVGDTIVARTSGSPRLDQAAVEIIRRWLFKPATENGRSVPAWTDANVRFELR